MWSCFVFYSICRQIFTVLSLSFIRLKLFCNSLSLSLCLSVCLCSCLSVCPENSDLHLSYFAEFVCWEALDSNSFFVCFVRKMWGFVLFVFSRKMCFSLLQLFVFLFDVLSAAVFVIRDRFVKKADLCLTLYPCVIKYSLSLSLSLSLSTITSTITCTNI